MSTDHTEWWPDLKKRWNCPIKFLTSQLTVSTMFLVRWNKRSYHLLTVHMIEPVREKMSYCQWSLWYIMRQKSDTSYSKWTIFVETHTWNPLLQLDAGILPCAELWWYDQQQLHTVRMEASICTETWSSHILHIVWHRYGHNPYTSVNVR